MESPNFLIIINYKNYSEISGEKGEMFAHFLDEFALEKKIPIMIAPHTLDLRTIATNTPIPVIAQHVDATVDGKPATGKISVADVKQAGASAIMINHSEYPQSMEDISKLITAAQELGMTTVVCVKDLAEAREVDDFGPSYIAYEPEELIGGTVSVADAKPEIIADITNAIVSPLLIGAGITKADDLQRAMNLGAVGCLVASSIVKAEDPAQATRELLDL